MAFRVIQGVRELVLWPQKQLDRFSKLHRRPGWLEHSKERGAAISGDPGPWAG